jgi:hypothetical protein
MLIPTTIAIITTTIGTKNHSSHCRVSQVSSPLRDLGSAASMLSCVAMSTPKQQIETLLHKLPENCSLEDIQYHLYVLDKVRRGVEDAKQHGTFSQDDVEKRLSQ